MHLAAVRTYARSTAASRSPNLMQSLGTLRRYGADEMVRSQDGAAEYWYQVAGGAARECAQISDGRRQIVDCDGNRQPIADDAAVQAGDRLPRNAPFPPR
jgi:hypothetical protein